MLFLIAWLLYAGVEPVDFKNEMSWYGEPAASGSYLRRFFAFGLENGRSEFLHAFFVPGSRRFLSIRKAPSPSTAGTAWRRRQSESRGGWASWRGEESGANPYMPGARRGVLLSTKESAQMGGRRR